MKTYKVIYFFLVLLFFISRIFFHFSCTKFRQFYLFAIDQLFKREKLLQERRLSNDEIVKAFIVNGPAAKEKERNKERKKLYIK